MNSLTKHDDAGRMPQVLLFCLLASFECPALANTVARPLIFYGTLFPDASQLPLPDSHPASLAIFSGAFRTHHIHHQVTSH